MEQLKKLCDELGEEVAVTGDDSADAERKSRFGDRDKILRFALAPKPKSVANDRKPSADDLATTLDIVRRASEAMRVSEERTCALETRIRQLVEHATEELNAAEGRVKAAEARAKEAEARAEIAEDWLTRIHDAIAEQFAPKPAVLGSAAA
jgi:hypothetical protein